jgi:hypothetical protein
MLLMSDAAILDGYHQFLLVVSEVSAMDVRNEFTSTYNQPLLTEPPSMDAMFGIILFQYRLKRSGIKLQFVFFSLMFIPHVNDDLLEIEIAVNNLPASNEPFPVSCAPATTFREKFIDALIDRIVTI